VVAFVRVGMGVHWDDATMGVADMVNEGVRRAYLDPDNVLRASVVSYPAGKRKNTATTRLRWCISIWCRATRWKCASRPRAAGRRTRRASRCLIRG